MMPSVSLLNIRRGPHLRSGPRAWASATALLALATQAAPAVTDPAAIARELVAARVGMAPAQVRVWTVTPRTFADASLGCPEPGMAYAQVLTPGHVVGVEADGRRFEVRVAGSSGRICHAAQSTAHQQRPATKGTMAAPATAVERARRDLAGLAGLPLDAITILETRPRGPREGLPGCGSEPSADGEVVLTLGADGRQYRYLLRGDQAIACPDAADR